MSENLPGDGVPPYTMRDFILKGRLLDDPARLSAVMLDPDAWLDDYTSLLLVEILTTPDSVNRLPVADVNTCLQNLLALTSSGNDKTGENWYQATKALQMISEALDEGDTGPLWGILNEETRSAAVMHALLK